MSHYALVTRQMVLTVLPLASGMAVQQVADGVWGRYIGTDDIAPADLEGRVRSHLKRLRVAGLARRNQDGYWTRNSETAL